MALVEDFKVDGTSVMDYAVIVEDFSGVHTVGPLRGSNYVVPGRDGELWAPKVRGAYGFSLGLAVLPVDPDTGAEDADLEDRIAQWTTNWRALMLLLDSSGGPLTVTRVVSTAAGTVTETCQAEVVGQIAPSMVGPAACRCVVDFVNLDGDWTEVVGS